MIGADEARAPHRIAALDEARAAVAADVEEDMRRTVLVASHEQGLAEAVVGYRHVAIGEQRRRSDDERQAGEEARLLGGEAFRAGVGGGIDMADAAGSA